MKIQQVLNNLFYINDELTFENVDAYFEKLGFQNQFRETTRMSFIRQDLNHLSWYMINIVNGEILNSSYKTNEEIDLKSLHSYAQTIYNFDFEEEVDNIIIYKNGNLNLHFRKLIFPESEFSKVIYHISLFEPLNNNTSEVNMMRPSI